MDEYLEAMVREKRHLIRLRIERMYPLSEYGPLLQQRLQPAADIGRDGVSVRDGRVFRHPLDFVRRRYHGRDGGVREKVLEKSLARPADAVGLEKRQIRPGERPQEQVSVKIGATGVMTITPISNSRARGSISLRQVLSPR